MKLKIFLLLCSVLFITACENEKPTIDSEAVTTATEDQLYSYTIEASDKHGDELEYSVTTGTTLPSWLSLSPGYDGQDIVSLDYPLQEHLTVDEKGNFYYVCTSCDNEDGTVIYKVDADGIASRLILVKDRYFDNLTYNNNRLYYSDYVSGHTNNVSYVIKYIDLTNISNGSREVAVIENALTSSFIIRDGFVFTAIYSGDKDFAIVKQQISNPEKRFLVIKGSLSTLVPEALAFSSSGNIYVAGYVTYNNILSTRIVRYTPTLQLDTSYGGGGGVILPGCYLAATLYADPKSGIYINCLNIKQLNFNLLKINDGAANPINILTNGGAVTFRKNGDVLFYDYKTYKIRKLVKESPVLSGTPGDADVGEHSISITVSDGTYSVEQAFSVSVQNVNDLPTGNLVISGQAKQYETVTANPSGLNDDDGFNKSDIQYQWLLNNEVIEDATENNYTLTQDDVGQSITVQGRYTDNYGAAELVESAAIVPLDANDPATGGVLINGIATQGQTLSASNNITDPDGIAGDIRYQWYRNGVAIDGATSSTYVLTQLDVGAAITVEARFIDGTGATNTIISVQTAPVENINDPVTGTLTISGTPAEYSTLTATAALTDPDGLGSFTYTWYAHSGEVKAQLAASSANTYVLKTADIGKTISVSVSYIDGFDSPEAMDSAQTSEVVNTNDAPAGGVTVSVSNDNYMEGETLTAVAAITDKDGMDGSVLSYQWFADAVEISGATNTSYILTAAEVGKTITAQVRYVDDYDTAESVTSAATPVIAALPANYTNVDLGDISNGTGGIVISGVGFPTGAIGDAIASGDVNGDGYSDLILGAPRDTFDDGIVYVVFGSAAGINTDINVADIGSSVAGFKITGAAGIRSQLGFKVAYVADMNGDGNGEIIAAAPSILDGSFNPIGGSYVVFGKGTTTTVDVATLAADNAGFEIVPGAADRLLGSSVAAAGDVNGDTIPDVIVGAYGTDNANGAAYVVFGKATSAAVDVSQLAVTNEGFAMQGSFLANAGYAVASLGDISGDGKADLMVSAPDDPMDATTEGKTYVVLGKADSTAVNLADLVSGGANDAAGFVIVGEKNDDFSGDQIASVGDVNDDNVTDFAIAASFFSTDAGVTRPGRVYVIFGSIGMSADINLADIAAGIGGFMINADVADDIHLGVPIAAAGDVNGDGFDDIAVGAFGTDPFPATGAAYVVFGKDNTSAVKVSELIAETGGYQVKGVAGDLAGREVANAGDINGDGKADLAVGAPGNFKVYIVFGK